MLPSGVELVIPDLLAKGYIAVPRAVPTGCCHSPDGIAVCIEESVSIPSLSALGTVTTALLLFQKIVNRGAQSFHRSGWEPPATAGGSDLACRALLTLESQ